MIKLKYIRQGRKVHNIEDGTARTFDSVNQAKKESRKLQIAENGAQGRGVLRVHGS